MKKVSLPLISLFAVIVGAVALDNSSEYWYISVPLVVIGMVGCFVSVVKIYRDGRS